MKRYLAISITFIVVIAFNFGCNSDNQLVVDADAGNDRTALAGMNITVSISSETNPDSMIEVEPVIWDGESNFEEGVPYIFPESLKEKAAAKRTAIADMQKKVEDIKKKRGNNAVKPASYCFLAYADAQCYRPGATMSTSTYCGLAEHDHYANFSPLGGGDDFFYHFYTVSQYRQVSSPSVGEPCSIVATARCGALFEVEYSISTC